jgi:PLP dependent protein
MAVIDRYKDIQERIARAAAKSRRAAKDITFIAVTKSAAPEGIKQLIEAGHREFGESRVLQLQQRAAQIQEWLARSVGKGPKPLPAPEDIHWHMIGHLQRNKVKPVLTSCMAIHSVDSLRLAEEIHAGIEKLNRPMQVYLEVNVSGENSKCGVAVGAAVHLAEQIDTMEGVHLVGLMTMAPYSEDPENARPHFVRLREVFEEVRFRKIGGDRFKHLSMGMSGDFEVAIQEGATVVRIGTALFG